MKKLLGILGGLLFVTWLGWPNGWLIAGGWVLVLVLGALGGKRSPSREDETLPSGPPYPHRD